MSSIPNENEKTKPASPEASHANEDDSEMEDDIYQDTEEKQRTTNKKRRRTIVTLSTNNEKSVTKEGRMSSSSPPPAARPKRNTRTQINYDEDNDDNDRHLQQDNTEENKRNRTTTTTTTQKESNSTTTITTPKKQQQQQQQQRKQYLFKSNLCKCNWGTKCQELQNIISQHCIQIKQNHPLLGYYRIHGINNKTKNKQSVIAIRDLIITKLGLTTTTTTTSTLFVARHHFPLRLLKRNGNLNQKIKLQVPKTKKKDHDQDTMDQDDTDDEEELDDDNDIIELPPLQPKDGTRKKTGYHLSTLLSLQEAKYLYRMKQQQLVPPCELLLPGSKDQYLQAPIATIEQVNAIIASWSSDHPTIMNRRPSDNEDDSDDDDSSCNNNDDHDDQGSPLLPLPPPGFFHNVSQFAISPETIEQYLYETFQYYKSLSPPPPPPNDNIPNDLNCSNTNTTTWEEAFQTCDIVTKLLQLYCHLHGKYSTIYLGEIEKQQTIQNKHNKTKKKDTASRRKVYKVYCRPCSLWAEGKGQEDSGCLHMNFTYRNETSIAMCIKCENLKRNERRRKESRGEAYGKETNLRYLSRDQLEQKIYKLSRANTYLKTKQRRLQFEHEEEMEYLRSSMMAISPGQQQQQVWAEPPLFPVGSTVYAMLNDEVYEGTVISVPTPNADWYSVLPTGSTDPVNVASLDLISPDDPMDDHLENNNNKKKTTATTTTATKEGQVNVAPLNLSSPDDDPMDSHLEHSKKKDGDDEEGCQ